MENNSNFMTQNKAAKFLGITTQTLVRYRKRGYFNVVELPDRVGILYSNLELQEFKENYNPRQGREVADLANAK